MFKFFKNLFNNKNKHEDLRNTKGYERVLGSRVVGNVVYIDMELYDIDEEGYEISKGVVTFAAKSETLNVDKN